MRLGSITSLETGMVRDVDLRISVDSLFSEIAEPPGMVLADGVSGIELVEITMEGEPVYQLFLDLVNGGSVMFYASRSKFDVALVLDELESVGGAVVRRWGT